MIITYNIDICCDCHVLIFILAMTGIQKNVTPLMLTTPCSSMQTISFGLLDFDPSGPESTDVWVRVGLPPKKKIMYLLLFNPLVFNLKLDGPFYISHASSSTPFSDGSRSSEAQQTRHPLRLTCRGRKMLRWDTRCVKQMERLFSRPRLTLRWFNLAMDHDIAMFQEKMWFSHSYGTNYQRVFCSFVGIYGPDAGSKDKDLQRPSHHPRKRASDCFTATSPKF